MTISTGTTEKLDISKVIETTMGVIQRNFVPFALISAVFSGIPTLIMGFVAPEAYARTITTAGQGLPILYGSILAMVAATILQGALVYMTTSELAGRKRTIGEGLIHGLRSFLPLIGIVILTILGLMCGFLLLIVPAFILAVMWSVTVPAFLVEGSGIRSAFSRSRELTRNNRWRIALLAIIAAIIGAIIGLVVGAIFGMLLAIISGPTFVVPVTRALGTLLGAMINGTGLAVLYTELRRIKDGVGISDLAAVFD